MSKRVAVIGAGPSGLAQLRAFQSAKEKGATIAQIVVQNYLILILNMKVDQVGRLFSSH